jgi:hypothetical protein
MNNGTISIDTGQLYVCDMRYGPTEDGVCFEVEPSQYTISYFYNSKNKLERVRVVKNGISPDSEERFVSLSSELNMFGVFDRESVLSEFNSFEELFEWGDSALYPLMDEKVAEITTPSGNKIHCFRVGECEGDHSVVKLLNSKQLVGFDVEIAAEKSFISTAEIFRVELYYQEINIEFYIFPEYDEESLDKTICDAFNDYLEHDQLWMENILEDNEPVLAIDENLSNIDSHFSRLSEIRVYKQKGSDEPILIEEMSDLTKMPLNTVKGIRLLLSKYLSV